MLNRKIVDMFFEIKVILDMSYVYSAKELESIFTDVIVELDLLTVEEAVKFVKMINELELDSSWAHPFRIFSDFKEDIVNAMKDRYERSNIEDRLYMVQNALGVKNDIV